MYRLKIYIVEDEFITQSVLRNYIETIGYKLVGASDNAEKAWEDIQRMDVDLVLLDINLSGKKDGIWLGGTLKENLGIPFIYVTAYGDKGTVDTAVKTYPNGYLIKPFTEADIYTAIHVAMNKVGSETKQGDTEAAENGKDESEFAESDLLGNSDVSIGSNDNMYLKIDKIFYKVSLDDIYYLKSDSNYVEVFLKTKKYIVRGPLKLFLEILPLDKFVQCHRSYIVNTHRIKSVGNGLIMLVNGVEIPLSGGFKSVVVEQFKKSQ